MKNLITKAASLALLLLSSGIDAGAETVVKKSNFTPTEVAGEVPKMFTSKTPYSKYPAVTNLPYSIYDAYSYKKENIEQILNRVARYQMDKYGENVPIRGWVVGTFFSAFVAAYEVTGDEWYIESATKWGESSDWDVNKILHADDLCPAQTYLDIYFVNKNKKYIKTIDKRLSATLGKSEILPGEKSDQIQEAIPFTGRNLWDWCDALYMAPAVYTRMGAATGNPKYYEEMHRLFWDSVDFLYSSEDKLFHRDSKAETEGQRTPNGKKVFWGRGNGWVMGGLVRLMEYLPDSDPMKSKYMELYQDMAYTIAKYQMADGLWRSSVNDPEWYPMKETSGSGFYVYALAKGVNEGWLPRDYFMPIVLKGWSGLVGCLSPEGKLGYSQIVAGSPHEVRPEDNKEYATGAFILAAAEMLKIDAEEEFNKIVSSPFSARLVAKDGAWTWYNDERVVFHNNIHYAGYVKRDGSVAYTAYSLEKWSSCHAQKEKILSSWQESDDHDNASFLPLKSGDLLAAYTTHGKTKCMFMREIHAPRWNECELTDERRIDFDSGHWGITYQNLHSLSDEGGRIYDFCRGINYNPTLLYSDDEGQSWSEPIWIIESGEKSSRRPYVKYISNGKDRVDLIYTDGHPRDVKENNVYHIYYTKGAFYRSNGEQICTMEQIKSRPIKAEEGTLIFDGSTPNGRGWVHDLEYDTKGNPVAAFISSPSGDVGSDMRYWLSTFDGEGWQNDEIAYAGSNLFTGEQHYAGGIALKPGCESVVLSANVCPSSGEKLPNGKYQLFKGVKIDGEWSYTQLTFDPVFDHIRPTIVRGKDSSLFWMTGDYIHFKDYHTDIMMSYEY